jgi:hypothetical protein
LDPPLPLPGTMCPAVADGDEDEPLLEVALTIP